MLAIALATAVIGLTLLALGLAWAARESSTALSPEVLAAGQRAREAYALLREGWRL